MLVNLTQLTIPELEELLNHDRFLVQLKAKRELARRASEYVEVEEETLVEN